MHRLSEKYSPPPNSNPGEKFEYSNTGYLVLASVAEKASGIDFISFARTRIFVPLEMTSTDIRSQDEKTMLRNMAWGRVWGSRKECLRKSRLDDPIQLRSLAGQQERSGPHQFSQQPTC